MTANDEAMINQIQIGHAKSCIYCDQPFLDSELELLASYFAKRKDANLSIDEDEWVARVIRLPRRIQLSFLQFRPPLL